MTVSAQDVYRVLAQVADPELPTLSIVELGIVRGVEVDSSGITVSVTPTYSGCPAMDVIRAEIVAMLQQLEAGPVQVRTVLSPPWTSDWLSGSAKQKLAEAGIAPPEAARSGDLLVQLPRLKLACPRCGSKNTQCKAEFGATACKSLWYCADCREPFEYFKDF